MGLFDKKLKKTEGFELIADATIQPVSVPASQPAANRSEAMPATGSSPSIATTLIHQDHKDHPDYGINKAIELMRMLPDDNIELIVRVVKTTLESTNIKVATIIKDATRKQGVIKTRIDVLTQEIAGLEGEVAKRRNEIAALEDDHNETTTVKDRLVLAENLTTAKHADWQGVLKDDADDPPNPRPFASPPPKPGAEPSLAAFDLDDK